MGARDGLEPARGAGVTGAEGTQPAGCGLGDGEKAPQRSPGFFFGYIETGIAGFSAVATIRVCSATWAAG